MATTTQQHHIHDLVMDDENGRNGYRRHRKNTSTATNDLEPDPRFYSGRNPVPRIESLWDLYPDRDRSPDGDRASLERQKKILENTKTVTDPITGKE